MPRIKAKQSKKTQDKKKLIASKLMKISLKIDNYIYKQTPITEEDAEILLKEVASYTEKCYNDARCLQVIEKLIRCLKTIIQEQRELKKQTRNDIQDNSNFTNVTIDNNNEGQNKEIDVDNILNNIGAKIKRHNKNVERNINKEKVTIDLNDTACTNFDNDNEENIGFNKINCPKETNNYLIAIDQTNFDICSQSILDDDDIIQIIDVNTILNKTNGDKTGNYLNEATNKENVPSIDTSNYCDKTNLNTGKDNKINLNNNEENMCPLNEPIFDTEIYSQSILDNYDDQYNKNENLTNIADKYRQDKNVKTGETGLFKETKNITSTNSGIKRVDLIKHDVQTNLKQVDERKDVIAKTRKPRNIKYSIIQETTQNKNKLYKIEQKSITNKQNIGKTTHKKGKRETKFVKQRNTYTNEWKVPNKYNSNKDLKENNYQNVIIKETDNNSKTYNAKQNINKKTPNFIKIKKRNKYCTIYNKSVEVDLSWIENIRYVREVNQEEIYPALFKDTFWENCTLPNDWNDEEFLC